MPGPLRLIDPASRAANRSSEPSHPPSEPRPVAGKPGADAGADRPIRAQLIAALLLLLVLVVVPLYLWRRPRAAATEEAPASTTSAAPATSAAAEPPPAAAEPKVHTKDGVTVSDAKILACHDRGPKHTAPADCDRLPALEQAVVKAVLDASGCVPSDTPAGTIAFVVDASYGRHKAPLRISHARESTTIPPHIATGCVADVKKALANVALDGSHTHARYELEVDATYAGKR